MTKAIPISDAPVIGGFTDVLYGYPR